MQRKLDQLEEQKRKLEEEMQKVANDSDSDSATDYDS